MLKFKIADGATKERVAEIVRRLGERGVPARHLFLNPKRLALSRIFAVERAGGLSEAELRGLLEEFGDDIQYVEGEVSRRPM